MNKDKIIWYNFKEIRFILFKKEKEIESEKSNVFIEIDYYIKENSSKSYIKPIFIFGEKGSGKSFFIENTLIPELIEDGNVAYIVEANKLEELKDEIYDLNYVKSGTFRKSIEKTKKTLRKRRENTLVFLSLLSVVFLPLVFAGLIQMFSISKTHHLWFVWLGLFFVSLGFTILIIITCIYVLSYPLKLENKLDLAFKKLNDKNERQLKKGSHIYIFIDDLNRVIEKEEVYKIYKFINHLYNKSKNEKNIAKIMKNIIIIYINEKEFFDDVDQLEKKVLKNIKKYVGFEIFHKIDNSLDAVIKSFDDEYYKLMNVIENYRREDNLYCYLYEEFKKLKNDFSKFVRTIEEKLHYAIICLEEFKIFVNLNINSPTEFNFLFKKEANKESILDLFFYIKMIFVKICFKESYIEMSNEFNMYDFDENVPNIDFNIGLLYDRDELNLITKGALSIYLNKDFHNLSQPEKKYLCTQIMLLNGKYDILGKFPKLKFFEKLFPKFNTNPKSKTEYDFFIFDNYNYNINEIYDTYKYGLGKIEPPNDKIKNNIKRSWIIKE